MYFSTAQHTAAPTFILDGNLSTDIKVGIGTEIRTSVGSEADFWTETKTGRTYGTGARTDLETGRLALGLKLGEICILELEQLWGLNLKLV